MKENKIKCIVWDLDHTIWHGILSEDDSVSLNKDALRVIETLDERGILHSIASKNIYEDAIDQLDRFGIKEYFLNPQIYWSAKSVSIENIAKQLNLGMDSFAFVDDQEYELEEVRFAHPEVMCLSTERICSMPDMPEFQPRFVTDDSRKRRIMYINDMQRNESEKQFSGPKHDFLKSIKMELSIGLATEEDLRRVEELTIRTHQLNTTGYTYSYEELKDILDDPDYLLFIVSLNDRFGDYGKIGISLIHRQKGLWTISLFLMSCRVMSRGVGGAVLSFICNAAKSEGVRLGAEFIHTDRNKMMYVTYKFNGFQETKEEKEFVFLECDLDRAFFYPDYLKMTFDSFAQKGRV